MGLFGALSRNSLLRCCGFDDLESQGGGFPFEGLDL